MLALRLTPSTWKGLQRFLIAFLQFQGKMGQPMSGWTFDTCSPLLHMDRSNALPRFDAVAAPHGVILDTRSTTGLIVSPTATRLISFRREYPLAGKCIYETRYLRVNMARSLFAQRTSFHRRHSHRVRILMTHGREMLGSGLSPLQLNHRRHL